MNCNVYMHVLNANKLSLINVRKNKYMILRKYKDNDIGELNLRISNGNIEHVNEFNFLGHHLNSKLNLDIHVNIIEKRISRAVGIVKKMQIIFHKTILLSIYNTLIYLALTIVFYRGVQVSQLKAYFCNSKEQFELFPLLAMNRILNHY